MVEQLVSFLTKQRVEYEHSWAQRDWKPIGVWKTAGHDVQQILEGVKDQEERYNNVGERVYMIKFESSRTGKSSKRYEKKYNPLLINPATSVKNIATRTYRYQSCQTQLVLNQNETTTIAGDPGDPSDPEADPEADP